MGKTFDEICGSAHLFQIRSEPVQRRTLEFAGKIGRQRLSNGRFNLGQYVIPPPTRITSEGLVKRRRMTEIGYNFCQNSIRNRLAVGDHAVEVENQCAHDFNSDEDYGSTFLICDPASKWTRATEAVEHFLLHCVSIWKARIP